MEDIFKCTSHMVDKFENVMEAMTKLVHYESTPERQNGGANDTCVRPLGCERWCRDIRPPKKKYVEFCEQRGPNLMSYQQQVYCARIHCNSRYDNYYNAYNVDWHPACDWRSC
ncbi:uncharacterized protein [Atheta coriaria]|uniref:uncharacterized protein n=1 Tax=Dalotia coriaria TaxID=877792 RepID=UPI0031F391E7